MINDLTNMHFLTKLSIAPSSFKFQNNPEAIFGLHVKQVFTDYAITNHNRLKEQEKIITHAIEAASSVFLIRLCPRVFLEDL